jgi:DNA-binding MarR family transcriptional regulator
MQVEESDRKGRNPSDDLWKQAAAIGAASDLLVRLAEAGSDRLTLSQAAFFFLAAKAEAQGAPATLASIREAASESLSGSIKNTYRSLLKEDEAGSGKRHYALGWLTLERNPDNLRENFLRLTPLGASVLSAALAYVRIE